MTDEVESNIRSGALRPLAKLIPYVKTYKMQVVLALGFLLMAAITTLSLPVAVRRVIDQGFTEADSSLVNSYFSMLIILAVLLAISSAGRYYFVIWLGERVVADLRKDVFANVTRLSASFFDTAHSGEIISRLTADTTQIKSAVGATASMALRNSILGTGALIMMLYTSPKLSLFVIGAIPLILVPIITFGRAVRKRSREAQDTLAAATAYASESIGAVQTMQAYTNETNVRTGFSDAVDFAFDAARLAVRTRAWLTGLAFFLILSSVIAVLWIGASNVLDGTMSAGTLSQFLLYAVFAAGAFGSLSEVWGELTQAAGLEGGERPVGRVEVRIRVPPRARSVCEGDQRVDAQLFVVDGGLRGRGRREQHSKSNKKQYQAKNDQYLIDYIMFAFAYSSNKHDFSPASRF